MRFKSTTTRRMFGHEEIPDPRFSGRRSLPEASNCRYSIRNLSILDPNSPRGAILLGAFFCDRTGGPPTPSCKRSRTALGLENGRALSVHWQPENCMANTASKSTRVRARAQRLETRVTAEQKTLIEHAAALQGRTVTDFHRTMDSKMPFAALTVGAT